MAADHTNGQQRASAIIRTLIEGGVTTFFLAPGSRSTPLVLQIARDSHASVHVHTDERGAGFAAVGFARGSGMPAAVITTSGTAVANLYPAVVEASTDAQPLIVLSADRPADKRGTGANQTINQVEIFGAYVRYFADLGVDDTSSNISSVVDVVRSALLAATTLTPGPVQLNCQFAKPLAPPYEPATGQDDSGLDPVGDRAAQAMWSRPAAPVEPISDDVLSALTQSARGIAVVGRLDRREDAEAAAAFAKALGYAIVADIASQVPRGNDPTGPITLCDETISRDPERMPRPETVLHIGGRLVSTRIGEWLRSVNPARVVHAAFNSLAYDPFGLITDRVKVSAASLVAASHEVSRKRIDAGSHSLRTGWQEEVVALSRRGSEAIRERTSVTSIGVPTGPQVAGAVWSGVPGDWSLLIGNSLPVRDFNDYAWGEGPAHIATNRGASGIDGLICTAYGLSVGSRRPTLAVLGDLTTLHDLNGLALVAQTSRPIVVVVVNNGGGAIFGRLPIADHADVFARYFQTAHDLEFEHAAKMFGIAYAAAKDLPAFRRELESAIDSARTERRSALIEVHVSA